MGRRHAGFLGYNVVDCKLVIDPDEAERVRQIYRLYLDRESLIAVVQELNSRGWLTKSWTTSKGTRHSRRRSTKTLCGTC